ncbi:MAG: FumA C-terminus/TtdB family hydratase beta subunit [Verrucomicrobia bacterium]|nr:FumA C-terminus/TtdB family hydratase beta subunit [Verrucomicrobiota bacterium]MCG2680531.1 FumA C-terminus/TtdB family hydratase beta subunit [Kiritimatiellia bacterium]MBU4247921.1 FumA C-terminus/TtdB family hydratase beta subunit [Verrucomicrobiota bacterium]MBU4289520.1 FumA C-terminus/TtdB family hydratase beta subunit [Verrucomicrobiota bacterium]MBU4428384.1 FumA C-terminus/TtdB family hydratase beta subunit [Verrucomicrobiota bacterium]
MTKHLKYPFTRDQVRSLSVGDRVMLSGRIFTGRDRLHRFLAEGGQSPVDLKAGAIYHCGPVVIRQRGRWTVRAAGPTTSIREESYMPEIIRRHGLAVIIGKGGMGEGTRAACAKHGCVYLHAVGGAAQVLADKVERIGGVHFMKSFGSAEAMWELIVKDFPALVTMDALGRSLHERIAAESDRNLRKLMK